MRGPHNIFRLIRTGATLERTGAMNIILSAYKAPWRVRLVAKVIGWPFQWLGYKGDPSMPPATRALTALGPAYIKFGQILSTRPDVVGNELAAQMRVLQDKLPPFPMVIDIQENKNKKEYNITKSISGLKKIIKSYHLACSNYYEQIKSGSTDKLEEIENNRRKIHNEGAKNLDFILSNDFEIDLNTSRRLFTLLYSLFI